MDFWIDQIVVRYSSQFPLFFLREVIETEIDCDAVVAEETGVANP